jgi:hypothetical protein
MHIVGQGRNVGVHQRRVPVISSPSSNFDSFLLIKQNTTKSDSNLVKFKLSPHRHNFLSIYDLSKFRSGSDISGFSTFTVHVHLSLGVEQG